MSYHDRADGGPASLARQREIQFASASASASPRLSLLEAHGATVQPRSLTKGSVPLIQVSESDRVKEVVPMRAAGLADSLPFRRFIKSDALEVCANGETLAVFPREAQSAWASFASQLPAARIQSGTADEEFDISAERATISLPRRRSPNDEDVRRPSLRPARSSPNCHPA